MTKKTMNDNDYHKELSRCVKCGACKTNCPTYDEERNEAASARGKIALLKALEKKVILPNHPLVEKLYCCTMCGACERSCSPGVDISGLRYYALNKFGQKYMKARVMGDIAKVLMPRKETALALARGLQSMSPSLVLKKSSLYYPPSLASKPFVADKDPIIGHRNKKQGTVAIFAGCSVNYLYPQQGEALLNILTMSGYDVVLVKEQLCCGTPLRSLGLEEEARKHALKNTELFSSLNVEAVITLCPSCSQTLTTGYQSLVGSTIGNVVDASLFIVQRGIGTEDISLTKNKKVVYHDPCHLIYGPHRKEELRKILCSVNNVHLLESDNNNNTCCGFGGIFRYNFPDISIKIGQKRFENLAGIGADTIATACPGCVMQFEDSAKRNNSDIEVRHVVEILWEAMKECNR